MDTKMIEIEQMLLRKLKESDGKDKGALTNLITIYENEGMLDRSDDLLTMMYQKADNNESRAAALLSYGCIMEHRQNYAYAVKYYRAARGSNPQNMEVKYFSNNNLGFSLNQLGRFEEAMTYLEEAARIMPQQYNAYKNLGIAFQGLGKYEKAVEFFLTATRANAADGRSLVHLEELVNKHPELYDVIPTLKLTLDGYRRVVAQIRGMIPTSH